MRQKFTDKHKMLAYIMMNDPSVRQNKTITQNEIASLFGVSQSTVAKGIQEMGYKIQINNLQKQVASLTGEAMDLIKSKRQILSPL